MRLYAHISEYAPPLDDASFELRKIRFTEIALTYPRVKRMAFRFGTTVHGEVFYCGDGLQVLRVVALQPANELYGQLSREKRIFPVRFLPSSPPRVAKDVDVGRPEREPLISIVTVAAERFVILGASFIRDDSGRAQHQRVIPCCS